TPIRPSPRWTAFPRSPTRCSPGSRGERGRAGRGGRRMDTTPRAAALSSSCNRTLSDVETLRFDYAWKWFAFHAEQRTKMFNFMLVGLGILDTGLAAAIEKPLRLEAAVLAFAATLIAIGFRLLDRRN